MNVDLRIRSRFLALNHMWCVIEVVSSTISGMDAIFHQWDKMLNYEPSV